MFLCFFAALFVSHRTESHPILALNTEQSRSSTVKILKYQPVANAASEPEVERHIEQLVMLAKALASEIETLRAELSNENNNRLDRDGIDFYNEVERYEIELINMHRNSLMAIKLELRNCCTSSPPHSTRR